MRRCAGIVSALACLCATTGEAQAAPRTFTSCEALRLPVARDELVRVNCDSAFVYTLAAERVHRLKERVIDSLISVTDSLLRTKDTAEIKLRALVALGDSIKRAQVAVIAEMKALHAIEVQAYDGLRALHHSTDSLSRESIVNTDRALSHIKRVRFASYVSCILVGAGGGALAIRRATDKPWGALGGAAVGWGFNKLVMRVVR